MSARRARRRGAPGRLGVALRWLALGLVMALAADAAYLAWIWPDWNALANGPVPRSRFIERYEQERARHADWPPLRWKAVPYAQIPDHLRRAAVVAEDSRFYTHSGIDLQAIHEAMDYNLEQGRIVYGASTISQQTVKNLFLSPSRDPLRKWHELLLTWRMERHLSKRRILELYLNVAEFGQGIYGVQAAARHYWNVSVQELTPWQAIQLVATLPSPREDNPATRTRTFHHRVDKIARHLSAAMAG